ncbi:GltB/FmdC/FwdC-like GXGXG domain-containing protein [Methanogenium cariaci]
MEQTRTIDAEGMHYTPLNKKIRAAVKDGITEITLDHVNGQRFIGNGLRGKDVRIIINGVPGGDLCMFMSGPTCTVHANAEHAPGNTMDSGTIYIHGTAGDAVAHSMRGGEVYVRDSIGYRGGIHMKEYKDKCPVVVVGAYARAFLGEYMAGGVLIVLGRGDQPPVDERGVGTGIHGGEIYIRGEVPDHLLGIGAEKKPFTEKDREKIRPYIEKYCQEFGVDEPELFRDDYVHIGPSSARPFAGKYCWE